MRNRNGSLDLLVGIVLGVAISAIFMGVCSEIVTPTTIEALPMEARYEVTAYCPCEICCGRFSDGVTASGHVIRQGDMLIAADLPFGTMITVPGYGRAPVLDRGGALKNKRLDILFHSHSAALEWGRQTLLCEVEM